MAGKKMTKENIVKFISQQNIGLLSFSCDGIPYSIPISYSFDGTYIYVAMKNKGRKAMCANNNNNVCFVIYWTIEGIKVGNIHYESVICDGKIEQLMDQEGIEKAVRTAEKHHNLEKGTWDRLIDKAIAAPQNSMFWRITIHEMAGRSVG